MFTVARGTEITPLLMSKYIQLHNKGLTRMNLLHDYFLGKHRILNRIKAAKQANNKLVINRAKYTTLIASGYMCGNAVTYSSKSNQNLDDLNSWIESSEAATQDMDIATDQSIFGVAYELAYVGEGDDENTVLKLSTIDPRNAFVVYENNVTYKPVAACYYYEIHSIEDQQIIGYDCTVITDKIKYDFKLNQNYVINSDVTESVNEFGMINLFEVYNNKETQGDYEQAITLIDAYDILMSDRVNDKEQFVDALMVLKGQTFGDTSEERADMFGDLMDNKFIELDENGELSYLTRQFDEGSVEILRKAIVEDISLVTCVPQMIDENFSGNASGVALSYKFFPLDQVIKCKEKYFKECLKNRLRLYNRFRQLAGQPLLELSDIKIRFKHVLPKNSLEEAQKASMLAGVIPAKDNISQLSFIDDPEAAAEEMEKQKEKEREQFISSPLLPEGDDE